MAPIYAKLECQVEQGGDTNLDRDFGPRSSPEHSNHWNSLTLPFPGYEGLRMHVFRQRHATGRTGSGAI